MKERVFFNVQWGLVMKTRFTLSANGLFALFKTANLSKAGVLRTLVQKHFSNEDYPVKTFSGNCMAFFFLTSLDNIWQIKACRRGGKYIFFSVSTVPGSSGWGSWVAVAIRRAAVWLCHRSSGGAWLSAWGVVSRMLHRMDSLLPSSARGCPFCCSSSTVVQPELVSVRAAVSWASRWSAWQTGSCWMCGSGSVRCSR